MANVTRLTHFHPDEQGHLNLVSFVLARVFHKAMLARQSMPLNW